MAAKRLNKVLKHVRKLVAAHDVDGLSDRCLVRRFAEAGDTTAFEALVRRHGPMVLRVARQVLRREKRGQVRFFLTSGCPGRDASKPLET